VTTVFGTFGDEASAIALQGDGTIVAAGLTESLSVNEMGLGAVVAAFALARYHPNGSLDATFGTGGKVTTAFGTTAFGGSFPSAAASSIALQGDGKIVAAGSATFGSQFAFGLARYNPNGSLDATFGTGGKVTTPFGTIDDETSAIALQGDGKIVAAGTIASYDSEIGQGAAAFALARYNPDGSLHATFGTGGQVWTAFGGTLTAAAASSIALQGDGKIVAAGSTTTASQTAFALARYLGASPATTSTTATTQAPTTTTSSTPTTTTTTLPCTTARCTLGGVLTSPACVGQPIPQSVTGKLNRAETLIDQAATSTAKKARKLCQRARRLLRKAGAMATHAAKGKGKKAKLSAACATALKDAAGSVAANL
jgi:uncharacterized delta-60 repeat protein